MKIQHQQAILKADIELAYLKNGQSVESFVDTLHNDAVKYGCIQSLDQIAADQAELVRQAMIKKLADYLPQSVISAQAV